MFFNKMRERKKNLVSEQVNEVLIDGITSLYLSQKIEPTHTECYDQKEEESLLSLRLRNNAIFKIK